MKDYKTGTEQTIQEIIRLCACKTHNRVDSLWECYSTPDVVCSLFRGIKRSPVQDCTEKCHSTQHGDHISAAITRADALDSDLFSYMRYACERCELVRDLVGRTALHVAASCGRTELCKLLIENGADINAKDKESGFTALHRSVFCGKIATAVELIKLGANQELQDHEGFSFLDHVVLDRFNPDTVGESGELFTWGANSNNSLGSQAPRDVADSMNVFHKQHPKENVKTFLINQFHSVILTDEGKVYSCGHGHGGRLGLKTQHTELTPRRLKFEGSSNVPTNQETIEIKSCSIAKDHSLFLTNAGVIYSCGLNKHRVLGLKNAPESVLTPKALNFVKHNFVSVASGDYHSLTWTKNGLYTWGLNGGQLGHDLTNPTDDRYILTPKKVRFVDFDVNHLKLVGASTGATVFATERGDIYVLHQYQCKKIASKVNNLVEICVIGGTLNHTLDRELSEKNIVLRVAALTDSGSVIIWQDCDPVCRVCSFPRPLRVTQIVLNTDHLLLVTNRGEAYKGTLKTKRKKVVAIADNRQKKSAFHRLLDKDDAIGVKLERVPRIHRALKICSDPKGRNFGVIQDRPYKVLDYHEFKQYHVVLDDGFQELLQLADRDDGIVDVVLRTQTREFFAHRYILSSRSSYFARITRERSLVDLTTCDDDLLEQILQFIYTGTCDLLAGTWNKPKLTRLYHKWGGMNQQTRVKGKIPNPIRVLKQGAELFEIGDLNEILNEVGLEFKMENDEASLSWRKDLNSIILSRVKFDRTKFPELYDVVIQCNENKTLHTHKCVLVARSEYFSNMFSSRWMGTGFGITKQSAITLPFSCDTIECLLEFLYTDSVENVTERDLDQVCDLLKLADLTLTIRLKEFSENALSKMVTIKTTIPLLTLATVLNAQLLQRNCFRIIQQNLSAFMELRLLDDLDPVLLQKFSEFYKNVQNLARRQLVQYVTSPSLEDITRTSSEYSGSVKKDTRRSKNKKDDSAKRISASLDVGSPKTSLSSSLDVPSSFITPENSPRTSKNPFMSDSMSYTRFKAIYSANDLETGEGMEENFTPLRKPDGGSLSSSFVDEIQFPLLSSPPKNATFTSNTRISMQKSDMKQRMPKISQKQRKRLSSESGGTSGGPTPNIIESPKNPWKMLPEPVTKEKEEGGGDIGSIIYSEKKRRENLVRMKNKSLNLTQLEDKAMDELKRFYNVDNVEEELITIERVSMGAVALPVWVPK